MNSMELVRFPTGGARPPQGPTKKWLPPYCSELVGPVRNAIVRARQLLVTKQRSDGAWLGWQTGAVSLLSQLIFLLAYSEREDSELAQQCAATIRYEQRPDGGWSTTPDGSIDVSASVQAYFALKLTGHDPTDERMRQARDRIRTLGGADAADASTRYFFALLGQLSYDFCEPRPPESILFGGQKSRLQAPMSIVWSHRPVRDVTIERGVRELFVNQACDWPATCAANQKGAIGRRTQSLVTAIGRFAEQLEWTPLRRRAVNRSESQLLDNIEPTRISELSFDDLVWHIIALQTIGYQADSPDLSICEETLHDLMEVDEVAGFASPRLREGTQADSALVIRSLLESGMSPNHPAIDDGLDILCQPAKTTGALSTADVCVKMDGLRHYGATGSEIDSALPPDIDVRWDWQYADRIAEQIPEGRREAIDTAVALCVARLLDGQNQDGGWGSEAGSRKRTPSSEPVVTGAALESLASCGNAKFQPALSRGRHFLRSQQRGDGSWENSDGAQPILCTSAAIRGLLAAGTSADDDCIAAAANWLVVQQQPSGGWSGSATQSAWAILGLIAAGKTNHLAVRRGIEFLLDSQDDDGGWIERQAVFRHPESNHWFRNDLHSVCWPLLALSRFAVAAISAQPAGTDEMSLRLVASAAEF